MALRILGRRQDGYHEVSTVMVQVHVYDVLTLARRQEGLSVVCPRLPDLPQEKNLVTRAVRALLEASQESLGLDIRVEKRIPTGSGMGGGSSDAAATLLAVNDMLSEDRRQDLPSLGRIAASLGADVPFFLGCNQEPPLWQAALCTGIGDRIRPVEACRTHPLWLVAVFPGFSVNTAQAYRDWDRVPKGGAGNEESIMKALESGDVHGVAGSLRNDLEAPVFARHPVLLAIKEKIMSCGALGASMTGSGGTVYGICETQDHAASVRRTMAGYGHSLGLAGVVVMRTGA